MQNTSRAYEGMAACDEKSNKARKSLRLSILGDIFNSAENCELLIIVADALLRLDVEWGQNKGQPRQWVKLEPNDQQPNAEKLHYKSWGVNPV